jgi:hypothetical protein
MSVSDAKQRMNFTPKNTQYSTLDKSQNLANLLIYCTLSGYLLALLTITELTGYLWLKNLSVSPV